MKKQEAIEKEYGEYWESVKLLIDENGFIPQSELFFPESEMMGKMEIQVKSFPNKGICKWRPKSLQGIEDNNGWIKIESDADLPNKTGHYWVKRYNEITINYIIFPESLSQSFLKGLSYYKEVIKTQSPIY